MSKKKQKKAHLTKTAEHLSADTNWLVQELQVAAAKGGRGSRWAYVI